MASHQARDVGVAIAAMESHPDGSDESVRSLRKRTRELGEYAVAVRLTSHNGHGRGRRSPGSPPYPAGGAARAARSRRNLGRRRRDSSLSVPAPPARMITWGSSCPQYPAGTTRSEASAPSEASATRASLSGVARSSSLFRRLRSAFSGGLDGHDDRLSVKLHLNAGGQ